jgi:CarD family transcriptional regulator
MHGAGIIEGIEEKEILGASQNYYILRLPTKDMKVMLPTDNADRLGVRGIVSEHIVTEVFEILKDKQSELSSNWNRRYRDNLELVKTGDIHDVARVVRDLQILDREKGLSTGERKMLCSTKQILVSELALVRNQNEKDIERIVDNTIR